MAHSAEVGRPSDRLTNGRSFDSASAATPARTWILFILLLAAMLRIYGLNNLSPPGLEHDEVANWLIDRAILAGNHAFYFTDAYGHEALFHYFQSAFVKLVGDHALALRLPAAFAGLLGVAVTFSLARLLFGKKVALTSAALLAVLFWPVFYSRLGLRAITLPLVAGLSAYYWWRAWGVEPSRQGTVKVAQHSVRNMGNFALAGFFAGLSIHTYMAARAVPIFYALFLLYLLISQGSQVKARWRGLLLFWTAQLVIAAPLIIYLQTNPGSEFRISEIDAPLRSLLAGQFGPVIGNSSKILGMFGFAGDPLWRQNVAGMPAFDPVIAMLFYVSLIFCFWHLRDSRHAFLLLWLLTSLIPSIVTIDAPSSIRISNSLLVLTIFPALVIHNSGQLSTVINKLSTLGLGARMGLWLTIVILYYIGLTSWALFAKWPRNEEVQFVWQSALRDVAAYLDNSTEASSVAIAGWTPDTMDPPTMTLYSRRSDLKLSFFNPASTLLVPTLSTKSPLQIIRPTILPLDPLFEQKLAQWGAVVAEMDRFTLYTLPEAPAIQPQFTADVRFERQLRFMGYDLLGQQSESLDIVTYWQVTALSMGPRRLFLHVVDDAGQVLAEAYAFDKGDHRSQSHWQPGDIMLQHHLLPALPPAATGASEPLLLRLGIFDPNSCPPAPCRSLISGDGRSYTQLQISR